MNDTVDRRLADALRVSIKESHSTERVRIVEISTTRHSRAEGVAKSIKALNHEEHEGHKGKEKLFFVPSWSPSFQNLLRHPRKAAQAPPPDHLPVSQLNILTKRVFSIEGKVANSHFAPRSGAQLNIPGIAISNHLPVTLERNGYPGRLTVVVQPLWIIS